MPRGSSSSRVPPSTSRVLDTRSVHRSMSLTATAYRPPCPSVPVPWAECAPWRVTRTSPTLPTGTAACPRGERTRVGLDAQLAPQQVAKAVEVANRLGDVALRRGGPRRARGWRSRGADRLAPPRCRRGWRALVVRRRQSPAELLQDMEADLAEALPLEHEPAVRQVGEQLAHQRRRIDGRRIDLTTEPEQIGDRHEVVDIDVDLVAQSERCRTRRPPRVRQVVEAPQRRAQVGRRLHVGRVRATACPPRRCGSSTGGSPRGRRASASPTPEHRGHHPRAAARTLPEAAARNRGTPVTASASLTDGDDQ